MRARPVSILVLCCMALAFAGCIQEGSEEVELRLEGDGAVFQRRLVEGIGSSEIDSAKVADDFKALVKRYEPVITRATPDPDLPGRIILRREMVVRRGRLVSLEEARFPGGYDAPPLSLVCSNGRFSVSFDTNDFDVAHNGSPERDQGSGSTIVVSWPAHQRSIWWRKTSRAEVGTNLVGLFEEYVARGRVLPEEPTNAAAGAEGSAAVLMQGTNEEVELRLEGDGTVFQRIVMDDIGSARTNRADLAADFMELIERYEPPIVNPTPDPERQGRTILHRELLLSGDRLRIIEEARYADGYAGAALRPATSNGFIYMLVNTDVYDFAHNGSPVREPGADGALIVSWPTNQTSIWWKRTCRRNVNTNFVGLYLEYISRGRRQQ